MSIYDHFRSEEVVLVDKVLEWKNAAEEQHKVKVTEFLDPREQQIVTSLIGSQSDVMVHFYGGVAGAQRQRAIVAQSYIEPKHDDFQIEALQIEYATKFATIEHRQVLGTLMSLGLKREKYGDIFIQDKKVYIVVAKEIVDYVKLHLQTIGKVRVEAVSISPTDIVYEQEVWQEQHGTVSSLRLDVLLAEMFNISRQKTQLLIKSGLVKVNWKTIEQTSFSCLEGDLFSVRGYGRAKLLSIDGKSKRDKWKIVCGLLK